MRAGAYTFRDMIVPAETIETINAYILEGRPTGGFLEAVIDNNLREACGRADSVNARIIPAIVAYFYNECPFGSWGREGAYESWLTRKMEARNELA